MYVLSSDFRAIASSFCWLDYSTLLFNCPYCRKFLFKLPSSTISPIIGSAGPPKFFFSGEKSDVKGSWFLSGEDRNHHHRQAQTAADRLTAQRYISENSGTGAKCQTWLVWMGKEEGSFKVFFVYFFCIRKIWGHFSGGFWRTFPKRHRLFCLLRFSLHKTCVWLNVTEKYSKTTRNFQLKGSAA